VQSQDLAPLVSIIVPVRGRKDDLRRLLDSLCAQANELRSLGGELLVVDDGSRESLAELASTFESRLPLRYFRRPQEGRSKARNYGAGQSQARYLLFVDSDCEFPEGFVSRLGKILVSENPEFWGGPDLAHAAHSYFSQAVAYSMSSLLTSGGLRVRASSRVSRYYPRGMNLGVRRQLFLEVGAFRELMGEDIELGLRLETLGVRARCLNELAIFHRHRTSSREFLEKSFEAGFSKSEIYLFSGGTGLQWLHFMPSVGLIVFLMSVCLVPVVALATGIVGSMSLVASARLSAFKFGSALWVPWVFCLQTAGFGSGFPIGFLFLRMPQLRKRFLRHYGYGN
jgi:glycosyltransferase involved in cell wall biosynthesis